jgi:uncharacterized repeat protein (TIGR01451 family)
MLLATFLASPAIAGAADPAIGLQTILSGLNQPVFVGNARDGSDRLFILEQHGRIRVLQPGASQTTLFLDISSRVQCCGEQGLLGLAFHPQFATNRRFFVNYTRPGDMATVIAEYQVSATNPNLANTSETVLLIVPQPYANHNGGMMAFGSDGLLYIGLGDGGAGNDPENRAQNIDELLGKILRIDVSQVPYTSPSTNPFFGATPGRDEIYAIGLRNPWRFSFDRVTGQLYVADVGQAAREEVNLVTLGGNYGWRVFEGTFCTNLGPASCSTPGFIPPITEYGHESGRCSVTGGYAYRGPSGVLPAGSYIYGDFCSGEMFLFHEGAARMILDTPLNISSFGEDESGELYVVNLGGTISRIVGAPVLSSVVPQSAFVGSTVNVTLTGTGFISGLSISAGSGVTASDIQVVNSTQITATLTIAANAAPGARSLTVTTGGGASGSVPFFLNQPAPTLVDNPRLPAAPPGTAVNVTLTGNYLFDPTIAVAGSGVTVSNVNAIDSTSVTATFTVSPSADPGARSVTVATAAGTSGAIGFIVSHPFPDPEIYGVHAAAFGVGFDESYVVTVRNTGAQTSSGAITVTDTLPNGLTLVSAGGAGWSCSGSGQNVTCVTSTSLELNASASFTLVVAVEGAAAPGVVHTVSMSADGDLNLQNNTHADNTVVVATPSPTFVFTPSPPVAGQQAAVALSLSTPFPHDVTGTLRLAFSPDPVVGINDPAIQFATGGRETTFVIPANTLQARFPGPAQSVSIGFQTGTVAGAFAFSGTVRAGRIESNFPTSGLQGTFTIPPQPPVIQSVRTSNQGEFAALITSFSTARAITHLTLNFSTTVPVQLSCGSVPGCSVSGSSITLNVESLFAPWFGSAPAALGSLSMLRLPLSISGSVQGSIAVTLRNSRGISNSQSFALP